MAALKNTRVKYFVMEHDNPKDAARFAERSIATAQDALRHASRRAIPAPYPRVNARRIIYSVSIA